MSQPCAQCHGMGHVEDEDTGKLGECPVCGGKGYVGEMHDRTPTVVEGVDSSTLAIAAPKPRKHAAPKSRTPWTLLLLIVLLSLVAFTVGVAVGRRSAGAPPIPGAQSQNISGTEH